MPRSLNLLQRGIQLRDGLLQRLAGAEGPFMMGVAVLVGCLGGLGAVAFRSLIGLVQSVAWGAEPYSLELVRGHPWWWVVLIPAVGGLLVGPLVYFFAREARGPGVPEVMESVALRSGVIRPRLIAVKSLASALTIGTGGSVGREGPIIQIGAALGSAVGQLLRVSGSRLRTLAGCGAAAGIAAAFNAPVAGALFAVEVILGDFGVAQFSPIVISSVMATVVSRSLLGNQPVFDVPPHGLESVWELGIYGLLGLAAAGVALAFMTAISRTEDTLDRVPVPKWFLPVVGGLMVGALGVAFPEILGVGYEAIDLVLNGEMAVGLLLTLVLIKVLATSLTVGSGGSGGVFAPSLFLGAMTGGAVGALANLWLPEVTGSPGAYALVGMGAVVAGTTHAPLSAILIIFELTSDYTLILPLMASCIVAVVVTRGVRGESIYTMKLLRRGVDVFQGKELNVLKGIRVEEVMRRDVRQVNEGETLPALVEGMAEGMSETLFVRSEDGTYVGRVDFEDFRRAVGNAEYLSGLVVAGDLVRDGTPVVRPDQGLDEVMRIFAGRAPNELPVVSPETGRLLGVVTQKHLLEAYNQELLKRDMATGLAGALATSSAHEVPLAGGSRMMEVDVPGALIGRPLRELDVRARYGVQILLVHRPGTPGAGGEVEVVPGPDTVLQRGDRLVILGRSQDLDRLGRW